MKIGRLFDLSATLRTVFFIDLDFGTLHASLSRTSARRQTFRHQVTFRTCIRFVLIRTFLFLARALVRIAAAFIRLFIHDIHETFGGEFGIGTNGLFRFFVYRYTIGALFWFIYGATAAIE